ncbi:MAG: hypothetical protein H0W06_00610 [Chloroflexia bacterium]|nr:hypothetical protein [Chloroflexia bacterium]
MDPIIGIDYLLGGLAGIIPVYGEQRTSLKLTVANFSENFLGIYPTA